MGVQKNGGSIGTSAHPLTDHVGMGISLAQHLHRLEAALLEKSGHVLGGSHHLFGIEAGRRDAGDPRQGAELLDTALETSVESLENGFRRNHGGTRVARGIG